MSEVQQAGPDAARLQRERIVAAHARGHSLLDDYAVPRFDGTLELSIEQRIKWLYRRLVGPEPVAEGSVG